MSSESKSSEETLDETLDEKPIGEPSLMPAIVVVSILALAAMSALCCLGSWVVFSNQGALAVQAIDKSLIPWVEQSQLGTEDKQSILFQLKMLVGDLKKDVFDKQQLLRLRNCLQDNPVLLWGGVQMIEQQAEGAGLTETEVLSLRRLNQRLLRAATERKMGRRDLEFSLQEVAVVHEDRSHLGVRSDLTADKIRSYMTRANSLVTQYNIPNEPFEKTPADAFALLVDEAIHGGN